MWRKVVDISNYLFGGLFNIGLAVGLLVVAFFVATWAFDLGYNVFDDTVAYGVEPVEVLFVIPEDASPLDIARLLREYELINNEWIFYFESNLNGTANHFIAGGTFALNTGMSSSIIMDRLVSPAFLIQDDGQVRLVEGLTNRQVATIAADMGYFTADEFIYELENGFFSHGFLWDIAERPNRLEGFLFPDTYNLPPNPTPRDLIVRQLDQFNEVFDGQMWDLLEALESSLGRGMTLEQLITVASIVEVEAIIQAERPIVASVIYNRLAAGMNLEMITTLVYATNRRVDLLTTADHNFSSPYNTFNRVGLPIGPISNPGRAAILSALEPASTNYLFMLKLDDGSHIFSETLAEHNAAIAGQAGGDE